MTGDTAAAEFRSYVTFRRLADALCHLMSSFPKPHVGHWTAF